MSETFYNATEGGGGKKLHYDLKTIGANDVLDEYVLAGEVSLSSYNLSSSTVVLTTANDHLLELMCGVALNIRLRRVRIYQTVLVTAAAIARFQLIRLSTAGTGGTVVTPRVITNTTPAAAATGMTLPTVKGTEGSTLDEATAGLMQTAPAAGGSTLLVDWDLDKLGHVGGYYLPAGSANGVCVKNTAAFAGASVMVVATFTEMNF